jgi:hypothetical protein
MNDPQIPPSASSGQAQGRLVEETKQNNGKQINGRAGIKTDIVQSHRGKDWIRFEAGIKDGNANTRINR